MKHDDNFVVALRSLRPATVDHLVGETFFRAGWAAAECEKHRRSSASSTRWQSCRLASGAFAGGLLSGLFAVLVCSTMFEKSTLPDMAASAVEDESNIANPKTAPRSSDIKAPADTRIAAAIADLAPPTGSISECLSAAARQNWYQSLMDDKRFATERGGTSPNLRPMNPGDLRNELGDLL